MGIIARLLQTAIDDYVTATVERVVNANIDALLFSPSGDDSPPLPDDRILLIKVDGQGEYSACGVLNKSQGAKPGERIMFSRDTSGKLAAAVKLLNDGSVDISGKTVKINNGGKKAARKDDKVQVVIPAGTVVIAVAGQATGTMNPADITLTGTIKAGSSTVEIGD